MGRQNDLLGWNVRMQWMRKWERIVCLLAVWGILGGCASPMGSRDIPQRWTTAVRQVPFPTAQGPKRTLQVRELRIPVADLGRYPELMEKRVGVGLSHILAEALVDSGRFDLLDEPGRMRQRRFDRWQRTTDGMVMHLATHHKAEKAEFSMSVKVFDIVGCVSEERIVLIRTQRICRTGVGVQVRIENSAGQFIPASTPPLSPQGRYVHTKNVSLFGNAHTTFAQSAVGKATVKAIRYAILRMLEQFDHQGW